MRARLDIPTQLDGHLWKFRHTSLRSLDQPTHTHDELEINLVMSGSAVYLVKDRRYDLKRNSLLWLFPDQEHMLIDCTEDFFMWIAVWRPQLVQRVCRSEQSGILLEDDPGALLCKQLFDEQTRQLDALISPLYGRADEDVDLFNAGLAYLLSAAWSLYQTAQHVTPGADVHPSVEKAALLLRDENDLMSMDDLARRCGISASRLSRLFKRQTGVSLVDYRNRQRVLRFVQLYGRGQRRNVTEAALQAGFGSYPQFHRVFKKVMGIGPAEYRRKNR